MHDYAVLLFRVRDEVLEDWRIASTSENVAVAPHSTACENVADTKSVSLKWRFYQEYEKIRKSNYKNIDIFQICAYNMDKSRDVLLHHS